VTIPAGAVKDLASNALAQDYTFSFTTQAAPAGVGGVGGAPAPTPTPTPEKVEKPIQAGATTVAEIAGKVKVEVPAGAVIGANAMIKAEVVGDEKAAGAGMLLLGRVVDITLKNGTLTGRITITLYFDKNKLGKDQEPAAFFYDEKQGKWVRLGGTVDLDKGTVAVTVDHLTMFAVLAVEKPAPAAMVVRLTVNHLQATVDGKPYTLDAAPFVKPRVNRTLVPVRFVSEALGARVEWRAATRQVVITDGGTEIVLTIGSREALVNGRPVTLDCPAELVPPGRTFVPLRFVGETLGAKVDWDAATRQITITR